MIGRRRLLGLTSLGLITWQRDAFGLLAQEPRPKAPLPAKSKAKATAKGSNPTTTPPPTPGQPIREADAQVNRILDQARTDGRRLPGIIGAILKGEELTSIGAVGIRKVGSPELIQIDDAVHLGSCTKAMTSTMIGTLVDEGLLRWNSTVGDVFPEWSARIHPDYLPVTLSQLLSHRGGFPHDIQWWEAGQGRSLMDQRKALLSRALQRPPELKPGSAYSYSNVGFVLAGIMAEQVTKTPWETLMNRRLFTPLKMTSAGFGPPGTVGRVDHAWGHLTSGDTVHAIHHDNAPVMGPAGTVHCTMADWARFASFHLKGSLGGVELLKPETLKALHTPKPGEDYSGGWAVSGRGNDILTHNGSNTYWYCSIWLVRSQNVGVLVATNAAGKPAEEACEQAVEKLLQYALPTPNNNNNRPRRR